MSILSMITTFLALLTFLPALVLTNTVTFYNYGPTNLMVRFTAGCMENSAKVIVFCFTQYPDLLIPANTPNNGGKGVVMEFNATGWSGNWFTYEQGASVMPVGVLGEVTFQPKNTTFYDVSTIVEDQVTLWNQEDGVHFLYPKFGNGGDRISGCPTFPCPFCYSNNTIEGKAGLNDTHTCSTNDVDLISYLGVGSPSP